MLSLWLCDIIGGQICWGSQGGLVIGPGNITALSSVHPQLSSLSHLTWVFVRQNMISLYPTIFLLSLITQTIASLDTVDTGEVEEVLYKDANTVQTFMRTREFKVSSQSSYSYPSPLTASRPTLGQNIQCGLYCGVKYEFNLS